MTRTIDRFAAAALRTDEARRTDVRTPAGGRAGTVPAPLPDALTWSATLDPHDDTREIEITDEMVNLAIASMDDEQVYPFRREAGTPPPVARAVIRADVIEFPR